MRMDVWETFIDSRPQLVWPTLLHFTQWRSRGELHGGHGLNTPPFLALLNYFDVSLFTFCKPPPSPALYFSPTLTHTPSAYISFRHSHIYLPLTFLFAAVSVSWAVFSCFVSKFLILDLNIKIVFKS